jgi:DNA adenine methylase
VESVSKKGIQILLSNSDPKVANPDDEFFDELYEEFHIKRILASRMINSKGDGRGKITEILVSNYD